MKSPVRRRLHWLCFSAAALGTLVALFYAEEDWRGARAWAEVKRQLQARGESLDFRDLIPPPIPDGQNLAMAPLFKRLFQYEIDPHTHALTFNNGSSWFQNDTYKLINSMPFGEPMKGFVKPAVQDWTSAHLLDLGAYQRYFQRRPDFPHAAQPQAAAPDVLLALTRYAAVLAELEQSSAKRPLAQFPVNWTQRPGWGIRLPAYAIIQEFTAALRLRAVAELDAGQAGAARRDLMLGLRLREAMVRDPIVIAPLVDVNCLGLLIQPVWEGLAAHRWSADDLETLSATLRRIDVLREYQQGIRGERAIDAAAWREDLRRMSTARDFGSVVNPPPGQTAPWLWSCLPYWPSGWYDENAAVGSRFFQRYWIDSVDPSSHRVSLAANKEAGPALDALPVEGGTLLAKLLLYNFTSLARKFARNQTMVDQAATACALEEYCLDHRSYPASLAELTPRYLDRVPNDVIDGAPMRYRLTVDGRYQLYSIGWDGQDGGGAIDWPADRTRPDAAGAPTPMKELPPVNPSREQGDWVWQYAPAEPPDPPANQSRLETLR